MKAVDLVSYVATEDWPGMCRTSWLRCGFVPQLSRPSVVLNDSNATLEQLLRLVLTMYIAGTFFSSVSAIVAKNLTPSLH